MPKIIDGKALALEIQNKLAKEITNQKLTPSLAVLLVGNDPASKIYIELKKTACHQVGIEFHEYCLAEETGNEKVLEVISFLNNDDDIDAILVQLPLPEHLDTNQIIQAIDPAKDVDGFHPENIQKFLNNQTDFVPGLPLGFIKLLESTGEKLENLTAIIIAKNEILYQPLAKLLQDKKIKTQVFKPEDKNIKNKCQKSDILISACGQPFFITTDMVKDKVIVIDVGTNKVGDYVVGDVDYSGVFEKAGHITPVPGGVGPMTVAMLLCNTVELAKILSKRSEPKG